jgi:DNA repair protein RadC
LDYHRGRPFLDHRAHAGGLLTHPLPFRWERFLFSPLPGYNTHRTLFFKVFSDFIRESQPLAAKMPSALPARVTQPEAARFSGWTAEKRVTMSAKTASTTNTLALLDRMKTELPEIWGQAQVVGKWVWLEFNVPPAKEVRSKLGKLGFHWNRERCCWQHPCGVHRSRSGSDPRSYYQVQQANALEMKETAGREINSKEFKVVALRECPLPQDMLECDTSQKAADYWRLHIATNPYFNPDCECFAVLMLTTRRRVKGHQLVTFGTMDTLLVHPREVFRGAIIAGASAIVVMHNHPSGEPQPSEADIKVTRDLIRAGQLMKIDVLDHVIIGNPTHSSLRELGYFYN